MQVAQFVDAINNGDVLILNPANFPSSYCCDVAVAGINPNCLVTIRLKKNPFYTADCRVLQTEGHLVFEMNNAVQSSSLYQSGNAVCNAFGDAPVVS